MPRKSVIPSAWLRRATSYCRARAWRGCTILVSILVALAAVSWSAAEWDDSWAEAYPGGGVLRDAAGEVMRVTLGPDDVDCRPYYRADPSDWIVKALLAAEDGSYFEHCGVRPLSVVRAAFQNLWYRRRVSGASTITMQTVRLIRPHPKTFLWKIREAILALRLERRHDKLWILSQYLNRAPFGSNLVGIEAAANGWFGKDAKSLGLGEAAMLAAMVQAPSRFRPDRNYARALKRRDYVLGRMRTLGLITADQLEGARRVKPALKRGPRPFRHPHYCDAYLAAHASAGDVTTPLVEDIQLAAEANVGAAAQAGGYSSAAVVVRVATGEVVALAVSGDYFAARDGQVNTARAYRPAGSSLKPLLTALAMDLRYVTPETVIDDSPVVYRGYRPANFDAKYRGDVTVREALILSLNIPFVKMLNAVGVDRFAASLRELGFRSPTIGPDAGLGLAIGNGEVTLLELTSAYARFARGDGGFSQRTVCEISSILSGTERSQAALGHVADAVLPRFAWKTGTSSAYRDAWTVLWNPEYAIGVWCGHLAGGFGDTSLVGAKAAAPVAWKIARSLYPQNGGPWFAEPTEPRLRPIARLEEREKGDAIALAAPEDGATIECVPGMDQEKIVCRVLGNPENARLWWFVDGAAVGESVGADPFVLDPAPGRHVITCATANGQSASAVIFVTAAAR